MKKRPTPGTPRAETIPAQARARARPPGAVPQNPPAETPAHGPRARMMRMLLDTAQRLASDGHLPTVAELAGAAHVSRATAYRYFPTQDALVAAVADSGLAPLGQWRPGSQGVAERVDELLQYLHPRLETHEAALRAAMQLSLQTGDAPQLAAPLGVQRLDALASALEPIAERLPPADYRRLMQGLSLLCGPEVFLVLKDIWRLTPGALLDVLRWTAQSMVQRALRDAPRAPRARAGKAA